MSLSLVSYLWMLLLLLVLMLYRCCCTARVLLKFRASAGWNRQARFRAQDGTPTGAHTRANTAEAPLVAVSRRKDCDVLLLLLLVLLLLLLLLLPVPWLLQRQKQKLTKAYNSSSMMPAQLRGTQQQNKQIQLSSQLIAPSISVPTAVRYTRTHVRMHTHAHTQQHRSWLSPRGKSFEARPLYRGCLAVGGCCGT